MRARVARIALPSMQLLADIASSPVGTHPVRVTRIDEVADGVRQLVLEHPDGVELPAWTPGAHIDLELRAGLTRPYSLCGDPADRSTWTVAVLREPDSRGGSAHVHGALRAGDALIASDPRNNFPLVEADSYALVAGGIGVTPLLPMVGELQVRGASWRMLYGGRTRSSMAYLDELAAYGERVTVAPEDEVGLLDLRGWLGNDPGRTAVYCCGPGRLLDAVAELGATWPERTSLHVERFRADPQALTGTDRPFEVVAARSGVSTTVPAGTSIVEALDEVGVYIPTSCGEGTCETCICQVIDGTADHRDSLLTDEQREEGSILPCCSRASTSTLVLDI